MNLTQANALGASADIPDSVGLLEHIKASARIGQAFGYPPSKSLDLVPLPGECLNMRKACHNNRRHGQLMCTECLMADVAVAVLQS